MKRFVLALIVLGLGLGAQWASAEWKNESEAGVVITEGNSKSQSLNLSQKTSYQHLQNKWSFGAGYLQSKSAGVLSSRSWDLMLRYDREINEKLGAFISQQIESNEFAGYKQRYNTDLGAKYYFIKEEKQTEWFAEAGYRFTKENKVSGAKSNQHKARVYSEFFKQWNESVSSKLWGEFVPNFTVSKQWLFNSEASLSVMMNSILSLKTAYLLKYSNEPSIVGAKKTDSVFTTSLVAKF
ncbi:MAG: DUF481 domain-containing protein [Oligoflexia bacterium]|nr:DUF481 domain-containing protein [Oligoflexia bacterium]